MGNKLVIYLNLFSYQKSCYWVLKPKSTPVLIRLIPPEELIHNGAYLKYCIAKEQNDTIFSIIHVSPEYKLQITLFSLTLIFINIYGVKKNIQFSEKYLH